MGIRRSKSARAERNRVELGPALCELLDHVARELAEEYVRLLRNDRAVKPSRKAKRRKGTRR